jgi:F-box-like
VKACRTNAAIASQADAPIQTLLPDELLLHILSLLPVRSLATACCVCQQWRQLGDSQVSVLLGPPGALHAHPGSTAPTMPACNASSRACWYGWLHSAPPQKEYRLGLQSLWRSACLAAFTDADLAANTHICKTQHK